MSKINSYMNLLQKKSFHHYLLSQMLSTIIDNSFKVVVMLITLKNITFTDKVIDRYYLISQILFVLPFLLFSGYAGFFADRFAKHKVFIATKFIEIITIFLAILALYSVNKILLVSTLFLLSTQAVFFSPAKYGILPEIFTGKELTLANSLLEMTTFLSIIFGQAIGGTMMQFFSPSSWVIGLSMLILSIIGTYCSLKIDKVLPSGAKPKFKVNPFCEVIYGIKSLISRKDMLLIISSISVFFALGIGLTTILMVFARDVLHVNNLITSLLTVATGIGIGVGSILSGTISKNIQKANLPLILIGLALVSCCLFALGYYSFSVFLSALMLIMIGIFSGLFVIPLNALLQELPAKHEKGRVIATNNFFNGLAMILAVLFIWFLQVFLHFTADKVIITLGIMSGFYSIFLIYAMPKAFAEAGTVHNMQ